jgi:hypothetical protein
MCELFYKLFDAHPETFFATREGKRNVQVEEQRIEALYCQHYISGRLWPSINLHHKSFQPGADWNDWREADELRDVRKTSPPDENLAPLVHIEEIDLPERKLRCTFVMNADEKRDKGVCYAWTFKPWK